MEKYQVDRLNKDQFFAEEPQSPLTSAQKKDFRGLKYFPPNPKLKLKLELVAFKQPEPIEMQTSTGDIRDFYRIGKVHFEIDGEPAELSLYQNEDGYFLPFIDSLAGKETYPAGRYLDPEPLGGGIFLVDFNLAYNPYCAYNDNYSCPLTPAENRLHVPIRAGEKIFQKHETE